MIGRALRAKMLDDARERPARIADRIAWREAAPLAIADREATFPTLSGSNALAAIAYQNERQLFHHDRIVAARKEA